MSPTGTANLVHLSRVDVAGGGQVVVQGNFAYVGHMKPPHGTTIVDVSDARKPRVVAEIPVPPHTHSHKVRVAGDIMTVNYERAGGAGVAGTSPEATFAPGLKIFDVSHKDRPKEIGFFRTAGMGVHRYDMDDRYAYLSSEMDGYHGAIVVIADLADPTRPTEVGRWWLPGQWTGGGETPSWPRRAHRCHHPLRRGDRLYTSYWHAGFVILDATDLAHPKLVSHVDWSPPYPSPTHTVLPLPAPVNGRRFAVVADEDVTDRLAPTPPAFLWMVDITDETRPVPVATHQVPIDVPEGPYPGFLGCHQPHERVIGTLIFVAWFSKGLRVLDIADPYHFREIGHYEPAPATGSRRPVSNDVWVDDRGLVYLIDRDGGLDILEWRP
jgi:hypothetical protein